MTDLMLLGVVAAGLQLCITSAYRFTEAVVISSMRYLQIPLAAFVAFLALARLSPFPNSSEVWSSSQAAFHCPT